MIDPTSLTTLLQAPGTQPAATPGATAGFQAAFAQALMGSSFSSSGQGAGDEEASDPARDLLPLLAALALERQSFERQQLAPKAELNEAGAVEAPGGTR